MPESKPSDASSASSSSTQQQRPTLTHRPPVPPPDPSTLTDLPDGASPPAAVIPYLKSVLRSSAFLQGLKDEELQLSGKDLTDLASRAKLARFHNGDVIIKQGEKPEKTDSTTAASASSSKSSRSSPSTPSHPLYILQSGPSGVYITKRHHTPATPIRLTSVRDNEIVGDMSLYSDTPPSVTVQAEGDVTAWQIDKRAFDEWIASRPAVKNSLAQRTWLWSSLSKNYLFNRIEDDLQKETLLSRFETSHADYEEPIIEYGEMGDRFYVVAHGTCTVEVPQITGGAATTTNASSDQKLSASSSASGSTAASPSSTSPPPSSGVNASTASSTRGTKSHSSSQQVQVRLAETDEEDVPASGKTGHAGKLVPHVTSVKKPSVGRTAKSMTPAERAEARAAGKAWSGRNEDLPSVPMVRIAEKREGDSFGEIALLYNVPRCATVRCISKDGCDLWSVDANSFLSAASKGSLYLKHIFFQHASITTPLGEKLMNQADFFAAVKHTKWNELDIQGKKIQNEKGTINVHAASLNDSSLKLMFHLADQSGDEMISFSEFVLLYGLLQAPFTKYQMAFRMFDKDRSGGIDRNEFIQVIHTLTSSSSNTDSKKSLTNLAKDPFIVEIFGPEPTKGTHTKGKQLTYAEFESLLSRDVLPSFLQNVQNDLKVVNSYWQSVDMALSQSYSDGLMSGSALSATNNAPKGTTSIGSSISWKSLVAGGVAGAVSRTLVSPFERLKLLFQMQGQPPKYTGILQGLKLIHAEDGIKGYFRGNLSNVIRITPASGFQFFFYDVFKKLFYGDRKDLNPLERLGAGGMAGMAACAITYPLDFIRARLTLQSGSQTQYKGITHGLVTVVKQSGVKGLYRGLWPSLVGVFPYIGVDFSVYETLRTNLPPSMKNSNGDTSRIALFCCGATAGVVGQTVAYPLDLVRRRLQVQGFGSAQYNYKGGILRTMQQIVKEEGVKGLYRGMVANYVKVVPAVATSFVVYEQMRKVLDM